MHGLAAVKRMLDALNEAGVSDAYCDNRKAYQYLDEAALDFCRRTRILTGSATITTVANQQLYDLPPAFLEPYERNMNGRRLFASYTTAAGDVSWPVVTSYEKIVRANLTDAEETPGAFAIVDRRTIPTIISGTASAAGAASNGESKLTVATAIFGTVAVRDAVVNVTDGSQGIVLAATDTKNLQTALFSGTNNAWATSNAFYIVPAVTHQVFLRAKSLNAGDTFRLDYISKPEPVFASQRSWRIPEEHCPAICLKAAALFMDTKKEMKAADYWHKTYELEVREARKKMGRLALADANYITRL